jgi:hypothetical protein
LVDLLSRSALNHAQQAVRCVDRVAPLDLAHDAQPQLRCHFRIGQRAVGAAGGLDTQQFGQRAEPVVRRLGVYAA